MKKIILAIIVCLCIASPAWANQGQTVATYAMAGVVSGATMHSLETQEQDWKNWLYAAAAGAAFSIAQDHDNKGAAIAGALSGCVAGKYIYVQMNKNEIVAGVTWSW